MENSAAEAWPPRVCLKCVRGDQVGCMNVVMVTSLESREIAGFSVRCTAGSRDASGPALMSAAADSTAEAPAESFGWRWVDI